MGGPNFFNAVISAASGLLGVLLGGWWSDKRERDRRRTDFMARQLTEFYGPLLSLRVQTQVHRDLLKRMNLAAKRFEASKTTGAPLTGAGLPELMPVSGDDIPKIKEVLFPLYRRMIDVFQNNMFVADPESHLYFPALAEYVESWERGLREAVPSHSSIVVGQSEEHLEPLYSHLEKKRDKLLENYQIKTSWGWMRWVQRGS
jgi:hypothetical protein